MNFDAKVEASFAEGGVGGFRHDPEIVVSAEFF